MQTTVIFKTDKKLKEEAQRAAKQMGIPFSTVMHYMMCEFVKHPRVTFTTKPLKPTPYLKRILDRTDKELKDKKHLKMFNSVEELIADLEK